MKNCHLRLRVVVLLVGFLVSDFAVNAETSNLERFWASTLIVRPGIMDLGYSVGFYFKDRNYITNKALDGTETSYKMLAPIVEGNNVIIEVNTLSGGKVIGRLVFDMIFQGEATLLQSVRIYDLRQDTVTIEKEYSKMILILSMYMDLVILPPSQNSEKSSQPQENTTPPIVSRTEQVPDKNDDGKKHESFMVEAGPSYMMMVQKQPGASDESRKGFGGAATVAFPFKISEHATNIWVTLNYTGSDASDTTYKRFYHYASLGGRIELPIGTIVSVQAGCGPELFANHLSWFGFGGMAELGVSLNVFKSNSVKVSFGLKGAGHYCEAGPSDGSERAWTILSGVGAFLLRVSW